MPDRTSPFPRSFTDMARLASQDARAARRVRPDAFGLPQVYVLKAGERSFTWELRRFGGLVLQRGDGGFASQDLARIEGETALATLCAAPGLRTFERALR